MDHTDADPTEAPADVPAVRVGGRYELRGTLGRGGSAEVHRALDQVLGRDVALKVLHRTTEIDRRRLVAEAELLCLLAHESIVTLYDADVAGDRPWLALELVRGPSLAELLRSDPPTATELADLGRQAADGLAHAHGRGVVHLDVKPSNVLVGPGGRVRLTDFGIARLVGSDVQLTLTGHVAGTAAYVAPEQVRGETVTGAADVYALGLVLLEGLTGKRAFAGPPLEAARLKVHRSPAIPTSLPRGWPALLALMRSLRPTDRPTAAAASERLADLARRPSVAGSDSGSDAGPQTTWPGTPVTVREAGGHRSG